MFRVPIWRMSAYSATMSTWFGSITSVMTGRPVRSRASARKRRPWTPRPWNAYGRGARLERAAAQDRGAGGLDRIGGLEQLVAALDRARPGHHRQRPVADDRIEDPDDGVLGMELARGQLERPADRRDRGDAGQRREALEEGRLARADLADDRDDDVRSAPTWSNGVRPSARIWLLTPRISASLAPTVITTNIASGVSSSVGRAKQKSRGLASASFARHDPCPRSQRPGTIMPGIESRRGGSCACPDGIDWRARCQRGAVPRRSARARAMIPSTTSPLASA